MIVEMKNAVPECKKNSIIKPNENSRYLRSQRKNVVKKTIKRVIPVLPGDSIKDNGNIERNE